MAGLGFAFVVSDELFSKILSFDKPISMVGQLLISGHNAFLVLHVETIQWLSLPPKRDLIWNNYKWLQVNGCGLFGLLVFVPE